MVKLGPTGRIGEQVGIKQKTVVSQPQISQEEYVQKERQKLINKELKDIDSVIKTYMEIVRIASEGRKKLEEGGLSSDEKDQYNKYDDRLGEAQRNLNVLNRDRAKIARGETTAQGVIAYASALVSASEQQQQAAQQAGFSSVQEYKAALKDVVTYKDPLTGKLSVTTKEGFRRIQEDYADINIPTLGQETQRILGSSTISGTAAQQYAEAEAIAKKNIMEIKSYGARPTSLIGGSNNNIISIPNDDHFESFQAAGSTSLSQEKYISSLISSPDANLEIQPYGGITLPYGQKDIKWNEPQFGSISSTSPGAFKEVSLFDTLKFREMISPTSSMPREVIIKKEAEKISKDLSSELAPSYFKKVEGGELSIEDAQKKYKEEYSKQFDIKFGEVTGSESFKNQLAVSDLSRSSFAGAFDPEFKKQKRIEALELGADITAAAVSVAAPPIGIAYFAGKGFYKAGKGQSQDIYTDSGLYPGFYSETSTGPFNIKYKTTTGLSKESQEAGISFLFAGASGVAQVEKIGADITSLRNVAVSEQEWSVTSKKLFQEGDDVYFRVRGSKAVPGASAEAEAVFPVKMGEKGSFNLLAGRGKVDVKVLDFMSQGVVKSGDDVLKSSIEFGLGGRGTVGKGYIRAGKFTAIPENPLFITSGEGYVSPDIFQNVKITQKDIPQKFWSAFTKDSGKRFVKPVVDIEATFIGDTTKTFNFGGISRKEGEKILFTSGRITKARLYPADWRFTGGFKPEAYGETLLETASKGSKGYTSFQGGGFKSSKAFLKNLYKPIPEVTKNIVSETGMVIPKVIPKADIITSEVIAKQFGGSAFSAVESTVAAGIDTSTSIFSKVTSLFGTGLKKTFEIKPDLNLNRKTELIIKQTIAPESESIMKLSSAITPSLNSRFKDLQDFIPKSLQRSGTRQQTKQITQQGAPIPFTTTPNINYTLTPPPTVPIVSFALGFPSLKSPGVKPKKQTGYIPQAKTKGGKWITLSKQPMTRSAALSRGARAADQTLSAQFRVKKAKGKVSPVNDSYFGVTKNKYRPYRIKKGQKIELVNQFIEKRGSRIDTPGEKKGLKLAKYAKQQGWLAPIKKGKKTKKKSPWLF